MLPILAEAQRFRLLSVGQVTEDDHCTDDVIGFDDGGAVVFNGKKTAFSFAEDIGVTHGDLAIYEREHCKRVFVTLGKFFDPQLVNDCADRFPDQFRSFPTGEATGRRIGKGNTSLDVEPENPFAHRAKKKFIAAADAIEFLLGLFSGCGIGTYKNVADELMSLVEDRRDVEIEPKTMPSFVGAKCFD